MKTARQLCVVILLLLGSAAMYGSYHMISDPTGSSMGIPHFLLHGTVFSNYEIIGWLLLFTVGLFSFFIVLLMLFKSSIYYFFIILQGVILCIFIFVQMLLAGQTFFIQYVFLAMGIALIILGAFQNQGKIIIDSEKKN